MIYNEKFSYFTSHHHHQQLIYHRLKKFDQLQTTVILNLPSQHHQQQQFYLFAMTINTIVLVSAHDKVFYAIKPAAARQSFGITTHTEALAMITVVVLMITVITVVVVAICKLVTNVREQFQLKQSDAVVLGCMRINSCKIIFSLFNLNFFS